MCLYSSSHADSSYITTQLKEGSITMHRSTFILALVLVGSALLWRSYVPDTKAAEARSDETAVEEGKDKAKGIDKLAGGTKVATMDLAAIFSRVAGFRSQLL